MEPVSTLHDFALTLLDDANAMSAFESDPTGVLQTAGLGDITAQDIHEILPLVADYTSAQQLGDIGNLAGTTAIAEDVVGDIGLGQALDLDSDVLGEVGNSGDLVHSVTSGLDVSHLETGLDDVTGAVQTGGLDVTDGLDLHTAVDDTVGGVTDNFVGNVTDSLTGNLTDNPVTASLNDVGLNGDLTGNLSDIHNVVGDVGLNGDVTSVVGDLDLGGVDLGGIGNGNDLEF